MTGKTNTKTSSNAAADKATKTATQRAPVQAQRLLAAGSPHTKERVAANHGKDTQTTVPLARNDIDANDNAPSLIETAIFVSPDPHPPGFTNQTPQTSEVAREQPQQPDSREDTATSVLLFDSIHPFVQNDWALHVHVSCGAPRNWTSFRSSGKLLTTYIMDANGDIMKATIFNDAVTTFLPHVTSGSYCFLSGGQIRFSNRQFSRDQYELSFDNRSRVTASTNQFPLVPLRHTTPISMIGQLEDKSIITVLGALSKIGPEKRIATKNGREAFKRELPIVDTSFHEVLCVLWGNHSREASDVTIGQVVLARHADIADYNGNRSLSAGPQTNIMFDPSLPQTDEILSWFTALDTPTEFTFVRPP